MNRTSLIDDLVESLLDRILRGVFAAHEPLPPEAVLAEEAGVSRLTAREAIKSLQAQKIVYVRRGLGTFVNPPSGWSSLEAILRAAARDLGSSEVPLRLLWVRRMVVETPRSDMLSTSSNIRELSDALGKYRCGRTAVHPRRRFRLPSCESTAGATERRCSDTNRSARWIGRASNGHRGS
ncbi:MULTISPECIES: FadR/GntR family transcriptional regulator [unclassified Cryobacterium]|uniref:FadR/GntR family transcriptional regulator n=1 Tax=unclassified Cryobacterium TaxID=2649013 RepID=UPI0018CABE61|nr:GntR family transcriptional regulator [Cryobacterium sp. CAN_C3]